MTEDEAKTKWCPMTRYRTVSQGRGTQGLSNLPTNESNCIGSECMAWRWDGLLPDPKRPGYCGLAGKP